MHNLNFIPKLRGRFDLMVGMAHSRGRVLEISSGVGRLAAPLFDRGLSVTLLTPHHGSDLREALGGREVHVLRASSDGALPVSETFDTILCLDPPHDGEGHGDTLIHMVEGLNPGGKLLYRCTSLELKELESLERRLRPLGISITHAQACDLFDQNPALMHGLSESYDAAMEELARVFERPGALELWEFVERVLFPMLPAAGSKYGFLVIERFHEGHPSATWASKPRLEAPLISFDATAFAGVMGPDFERMSQTLNTLTRTPGGLRLLVVLDQMISRRLPTQIDYFSFLGPGNRARILDLIAWKWAQEWHEQIPDSLRSSQGLSLPPLLEYEVFRSVANVLKPLKEMAR